MPIDLIIYQINCFRTHKMLTLMHSPPGWSLDILRVILNLDKMNRTQVMPFTEEMFTVGLSFQPIQLGGCAF